MWKSEMLLLLNGAYKEVSAVTSESDVKAVSQLLLSPEFAISSFPFCDTVSFNGQHSHADERRMLHQLHCPLQV
jgi:hypothetical protein